MQAIVNSWWRLSFFVWQPEYFGTSLSKLAVGCCYQTPVGHMQEPQGLSSADPALAGV